MQMQIDKKWLIALVNEVKNEINPEEAIQDEENNIFGGCFPVYGLQ